MFTFLHATLEAMLWDVFHGCCPLKMRNRLSEVGLWPGAHGQERGLDIHPLLSASLHLSTWPSHPSYTSCGLSSTGARPLMLQYSCAGRGCFRFLWSVPWYAFALQTPSHGADEMWLHVYFLFLQSVNSPVFLYCLLVLFTYLICLMTHLTNHCHEQPTTTS